MLCSKLHCQKYFKLEHISYKIQGSGLKISVGLNVWSCFRVPTELARMTPTIGVPNSSSGSRAENQVIVEI